MGRSVLLLLLGALCAGASQGHEGSREPSAAPSESPSPGPPLPELCLLPRVVGRCRAAFPRWWYNATSRECQQFTYGGCGANRNNFLVEDACQRKCVSAPGGEDLNEIPLASRKIPQSEVAGEPSRRGEQASNAFGYEELCLAKAITGRCRASFPRWWFDAEMKTCRQFTYGGCGGNRNNYLTEEECLRRCSGDAEEPKLEQPGIHLMRVVVLAVLLAIIAAVLLGAMVVVFIKICRKNQELALGVPWSPLDDKEYLMSNTYTL
uniref:Serine peptidase inhibitor, Kunitz type 2 n=1 Tax=Pelusios castaneus TaxID=367368 RepID=A0A8C8SWD3_9SAUR